jgi:hypothetical protein
MEVIEHWLSTKLPPGRISYGYYMAMESDYVLFVGTKYIPTYDFVLCVWREWMNERCLCL